jgi:hypothetical protein
LLSGVSARTLWRVVYATLFGGLGLIFLAQPFVFVVYAARLFTPRLGVISLIVVAADIVVATIVLPIFVTRARMKQREELNAGYTTLMPEFDQVDGISPKTRQVVRPAKPSPQNRANGDAITTGLELGALDTGRTPLQIAIRRRTALIWEIVSLIVLLGSVLFFVAVIIPARHFPDSVVALLLVLGTGSLCTVIIIPRLVIQFAPAWYYEGRLRAANRDANALQVSFSNGDVVEELVGNDAPALPDSGWRPTSYVVFSTRSIVFYSRHQTELIPYLAVPRERIVGSRQLSAASATLIFRKDNGTTIDLILTVTAPSYTSGRKRIEERSQLLVDWADGRTPHSAFG